MPSESTEPKPKSKSVITRALVPIAWSLWGVLVIGTLFMLLRASTERTTSPEAGRGLGVMVVLLVLVTLAVAGAVLYTAVRKQSSAGIVTMTLLLGWPAVLLVAGPVVKAYKERSFASEEARAGDFRDVQLDAMARAIEQGDTATLGRLLNGQPPDEGKDRAGNDLLTYALVVVRDQKGSASVVRVLLDAGADPQKSRMGSGEDIIRYLVVGPSPAVHEAMRLLLERGADPDVVDPQAGDTPLGIAHDPETVRLLVQHGADVDRIQHNGIPAVVRFIGNQDWESALHLVEKGARLDVANADGLSVDYYLKQWEEGIYGEHPEGWDKVRAAIASRRAAHN